MATTGPGADPPAPEPKMAPITILANPLDNKTKKLFCFSASNKQTLTVQNRRHLHSEPAGRVVGQNPGDKVMPVLADHSSLAAMKLQNTVTVIGITGNAGAYKATIVSPAFEPLETSHPTTTALAGHAFNDSGYVYFQATNPKTGGVSIAEYRFMFESKDQNHQGYLKVDTPLEGTRIACTIFNGTRWIVYQAADNRIHLYNAGSNHDIDIIHTMGSESSYHAKPKTPLAVSFSSGPNVKPQCFVYYIDESNRVAFISSLVEGKDTVKFSTEKPEGVLDARNTSSTDPIEVQSWSEIAVIPYPDRTNPEDDEKPKPSNLLFCIKAGEYPTKDVTQTECNEWK